MVWRNAKNYISLIPIGFPPVPIFNIFAHTVVDDDQSRIIRISPIGSFGDELQHYGKKSSIINIKGRITIPDNLNRISLGRIHRNSMTEHFRQIKNHKIPCLLMLNHRFIYGYIENLRVVDDTDHPISYLYEMKFIEKVLFPDVAPLLQPFLNILVSQFGGIIRGNARTILDGVTIPDF